MLISVTSILNYGLGTGMALLGGLPCLAAIYRPTGREKRVLRRIATVSILGMCILGTMQQFSQLRHTFLRTVGLAPVILYLGLVPIWLQVAFVA